MDLGTAPLFDLTDAASTGGLADGSVGRVGNTQSPVTPGQIKEWCGTAGTIIVRPVVDVGGHEPIGAYEIRDRHRRQVLRSLGFEARCARTSTSGSSSDPPDE